MTEIKTNFIKSKMNKDLDDRLIPKGEYRDAININVSASEGESVGTVETIQGNVSITDFGYTNNCRVKIIGYKEDSVNNVVYVFLTDFTDTSVDKSSYFAPSESICEIWNYNFSTNSSKKLVTGNFLNFSLTHPMLGIDLLEDLLFFTDNRNQPRKINVALANPNNNTSPTFYTNEDQISVAKYYPYQPIDLIEDVITALAITSDGGSGDPASPSGYKTLFDNGNAIGLATTGGTGFGLTVDITSVGSDGSVTGVSINETGVGYTNGDVINLAPKTGTATLTLTVQTQSTMRDRCSEFLPPSTVGAITSITSTTSINLDSFLTPNAAAGWRVVNIDQPQDGEARFAGALGSSSFTIGYPVGSSGPDAPPSSWAAGNIITLSAPNPDYDSSWPGDCEYLKDKFVRFSYRFKFIDNEYSLSAPFTQECFVPQQDGYIAVGDEEKALDATDLEFFQNKINEVSLMIPCPTSSFSTLHSDMHVSAIEVLYKESNQNTIKVVASIPFEEFIQNTTSIFKYVYQSRAPYKVLPVNEVTRVSDSVPVKAKAQAISGNRVIYANYLDRHTSVDTLDYQVGIGDKLQTTDEPVQQEYQNHTVKQNRTYQVGVVLSDRYGRQSDVILSTVDEAQGTSGGISFFGSTIYNPYKPSGFDTTMLTSSTTWPGDNLFLFFNSLIPTQVPEPGYPGLYVGMNPSVISDLFPGSGYGLANNVGTTGGTGTGLTVNITQNNGAGNILALEIFSIGTAYSQGDVITITGGSGNANFVYNPLAQPNILGWHSYKVVVKQQQQEYYNTYLPGVLNGGLETSSVENANKAKITLFGDNINKIPKDLEDVGPVQVAFRSNELLFFRVNNFSTVNKQYYPGTQSDKVVQLGTMSDLGIASPKRITKEVNLGQTSTASVILAEYLDTEDVAVGSLITAIDSSGNPVSGLEESDEVYILAYYAFSGGRAKANLSASVTTTTGDTVTISPPLPIYNGENNPFIGTVNTNNVLGSRINTSGVSFTQQLAVAETVPEFSNLNIYFETSTSGLVSVLNEAINNDSADVPTSITNIVYSQNEGLASGSVVTNAFYARTRNNIAIQNVNAVGTLLSVVDGNKNDRSSDFTLETVGNGSFRIKTANTFVVGSDIAAFTFEFNVQIEVLGFTVSKIFTGVCDNIAPVWEDHQAQFTINNGSLVAGIQAIDNIFTNIKNGSTDTNRNHEEITLEVLSIEVHSTNGVVASEVYPTVTTSNLRDTPPYRSPNGNGNPTGIKGALNQEGYVSTTLYPWVFVEAGKNPDGTANSRSVGSGTNPVVGYSIFSVGAIRAAFSPTLPQFNSSNLYDKTFVENNPNPQPLDYGAQIFGVVDSSNKISWIFEQLIGDNVNPDAQFDYKVRIKDGGGLFTDYEFRVIVSAL